VTAEGLLWDLLEFKDKNFIQAHNLHTEFKEENFIKGPQFANKIQRRKLYKRSTVCKQNSKKKTL